MLVGSVFSSVVVSGYAGLKSVASEAACPFAPADLAEGGLAKWRGVRRFAGEQIFGELFDGGCRERIAAAVAAVDREACHRFRAEGTFLAHAAALACQVDEGRG